MLVCVVRCVAVLISRHEKLNSVVLEFLVAQILWRNVEIACYVLNPWSSSNRPRQSHCGRKNVQETSDSMCTIFREHGIRSWNAASQAQLTVT